MVNHSTLETSINSTQYLDLGGITSITYIDRAGYRATEEGR